MESVRAAGVTLRLGDEVLDLIGAAGPPMDPPLSNATGFQHCAIIVSNMAAAMARLAPVPGWTAISRGSPERLPAASGGATAFKFRDPDGHPLEFLQFAPGAVPPVWRRGADGPACLGIDHSAITVRDADRAIAFYEGLGFTLGERHLNRGPEQARLDGLDVPKAEVEVVSLQAAGGASPHLELLCYRDPPALRAPVPDGSPFATRLRLTGLPGPARDLADPDGHRIGIGRF
nr:VOC family protein [Aureimonas sp. AU12]